jgi:hypothetical protein
MPLVLALVAIDTIFIVHAASTGRFCPWAYIILAIPLAGALVYVAVELVPAWLAGWEGQEARRRIRRALDPERRYRALADQLAVVDTIANRHTLADECRALGLFDEAKRHYDNILARPCGDEPTFMLGRAYAEFGLGRFGEAVATLDALKARWPHYESGEGHLLYARALEENGRAEAALTEYEGLAGYYSGAEPRVRRAMLLRRLGRAAAADALLARLLVEFAQAPKFVRKTQAEWIAVAEKALNS